MNLTEVIFTDGKVIAIKSISNGLVMSLKAYDDSLLEVVFLGDVAFEIHDCFSYSIAASELSLRGRGYRLELKNDEGAGVLLIDFKDGNYVASPQNGTRQN